MKLPSISIITLSYNPDLAIFGQVLDSIRAQRYPLQRIEHIVMDGGSTNGAIQLAKKYGAHLYVMAKKRNDSEERKSIGIRRAKGEIIAFIEADNILVGKNWFRQMVAPFIADGTIIGTFSEYNAFDKTMPILTRYCALFGVNDPVLYYLNKSEKLPYFKKVYDKGTVLAQKDGYVTVKFTSANLPTLGDNGHLVRRKIITKVNGDSKTFLHTDAFAQLASLGFSTYGVVKNSIVHYVGSDIKKFLKRRVVFKRRFYDRQAKTRKYLVFDARSGWDRWNLLRFIFCSLTVVEPTIQSIRGYLIAPDAAWFLHPLMCILSVVSYGLSEFN